MSLPRMVNWLYHSSGLFDDRILSLLTCQRWIVNSPAFSLVELHFFIQRCSKEFIPRFSHFHGSLGVGPSRCLNFLIKYLFAVKVPFKKIPVNLRTGEMLNDSDNITRYIVTVCKLSSNETRSQNQGGFQSQIWPGIHPAFCPSERRFVPQIRHVFWGHAMPCYHCKASQLKGFRQPCGCETNTTPTFILPRRCVGVRWGNKNDWTSWESCMKQKSPTQSLVVSLTFGRWLSACPLCRCTRRRCPKRGSTVPKLARMNSSANKMQHA